MCLGLLAAAVGLLSGTAAAQPCEAGWLPGEARAGMSSDGTSSGKAHSFALQPDGGVIIGFNLVFTDQSGTHRGIVRYDPSTERFTRMGNGTNSVVDTVLALPNGDAVMPHDLPLGVSIPGIPRFDFATGTWVSIGTVRPDFNNCFAVTPGGDLVMGGTFTNVGGVQVRNIARVNPVTGVWSPLGAGLNGRVSSVAVFPDGVIVASGSFTASGTVPMPRVAAYDPVLNTWSALAVDQPVVEKVAVSAEGVLYGIATITQSGQTRRTVAEYDRTTRVWRGLGFGSALNPEFDRMVLSSGGQPQVVVHRSGSFAHRLNRDTDSWELLPGLGTAGVWAMFILPSGDILAGGHFSLNYQSNQGRSGAIRFRPSVGEWATIGRGLDGAVVDMELDPDGRVWLGGRFRSTGGQCASGVARFDPTDGSFQTFPPRQFEHTSDLVLSETLGLVAVTDAPESGAPGGASILRLDPLRGQWSRVAARRPNGTFSGPPFGTRVLNELPDGTLVANGVAFARFDPTTWIWSFPPGLPLNAIYAQAVLPDGNLVVGGTSRLDILNTTTNTLTPLASAVNGTIHAIELLPNGDIVVGGNFTAIGGVPAANIARRSHETGTWTALGQGLVPVNPSSVAAASI
jgi:trimeric autotransporter adhesin